MQYLGIYLWIAFIGIIVWGNWFFAIIAGAIALGATIGLVYGTYQTKKEYRDAMHRLHQDALAGDRFSRDLIIKNAYRNPDDLKFVKENAHLNWIKYHYDKIIADAEKRQREEEEYRKKHDLLY